MLPHSVFDEMVHEGFEVPGGFRHRNVDYKVLFSM